MKKTILFYLIFNLVYSLSYTQVEINKLEFPIKNNEIVNLFYIKDTFYLFGNSSIWKSTEEYKFDIIDMKDKPTFYYGTKIIEKNNNLYILQNNSFNCYNISENYFNLIPLPDLSEETIQFSKDPEYDFKIINDKIFLYVDFYHAEKYYYYFDEEKEIFIKLDINNSIIFNDYDFYYSIVSPDLLFRLNRTIPDIFNYHIAGEHNNLSLGIDSLFKITNNNNEILFLTTYITDNTLNYSNIVFLNENFGFYYKINNQYFTYGSIGSVLNSTIDSKVYLYNTSNSGISWSEPKLLNYNSIYEIGKYKEDFFYMICSKNIKDVDYKTEEDGVNFYFGNDITDLKYYLLISRDSGNNWNEVIQLIQDEEGYIRKPTFYKFYNSIWLTTNNILYLSEDSGNTWKTVERSEQEIDNIYFPISKNKYYAVRNGKIVLYKL